jgi:hypothetical protein
MIFVLPDWILTFQKMQQLLPANFLARCFHKKRATTARTNQGIDFPQQVFGQQNVSAPCGHMCILSVLY